MFNDLLADLGAESGSIILVTGVYFSALCIAGLCAGPLIQKLTLRSVGLSGALIYTAGSLLIIFVDSVETLIIGFGILQGVSAHRMNAIEKT